MNSIVASRRVALQACARALLAALVLGACERPSPQRRPSAQETLFELLGCQMPFTATDVHFSRRAAINEMIDARFDLPSSASPEFLRCWSENGGSVGSAPQVSSGDFGDHDWPVALFDATGGRMTIRRGAGTCLLTTGRLAVGPEANWRMYIACTLEYRE